MKTFSFLVLFSVGLLAESLFQLKEKEVIWEVGRESNIYKETELSEDKASRPLHVRLTNATLISPEETFLSKTGLYYTFSLVSEIDRTVYIQGNSNLITSTLLFQASKEKTWICNVFDERKKENPCFEDKNVLYTVELISGQREDFVLYTEFLPGFLLPKITVYDSRDYNKHSFYSHFIHGMNSGFLILIFITSFYLFFNFREVKFVFYGLYVLLFGVSLEGMLGLFSLVFPVHEISNFLILEISFVLTIIGLLFKVLACKYFLDIENKKSLDFYFLHSMSLLGLFLIIFGHLFKDQFMLILLGFGLFTSFFISILGYRHLKKGVRTAKLYTFANSFVTVILGFYFLKLLNIFPIFPVYDWFLFLSLLLETSLVLISFTQKQKYILDTARESLGEFVKIQMETNDFLEEKIAERTEEIRKTLELVELEKLKSDRLLENILPVETARELKEFGHATPRYYSSVTIGFLDFVGFSKIAEKLSPLELLDDLDFYFNKFDELTRGMRLERIKTIGDCYMYAGGIPKENLTHALDAVLWAFYVLKFINKSKLERQEAGKSFFECRIGLHTGPVIAGVVGNRKIAYDIWGDSVNIASRMESHGDPGKISISESTYQLIKGYFHCESKGLIEFKNKGKMNMYQIVQIHPELSIAENGEYPGEEFFDKLYNELNMDEI
jgi:class 3 adenylate cyclase